jgi:putative ubiquitin-RnfH superfamily antitoxin RatB of RatAB toxin-antitoxin module
MYITVAYATTKKQVELLVVLNEGATVEMAIQASSVFDLFPEIDPKNLQVGIFSRKVKLTDSLREHDRIEIYRPLLIDPKEARRLRAAKNLRSTKL